MKAEYLTLPLASSSFLDRVLLSVFFFSPTFLSEIADLPAQLATAFIHLLAHGLHALESECLGEAWHAYVSDSLTLASSFTHMLRLY